MTSSPPILLACFVHLVLHTTLFIQLHPDVFKDTPILGSQMFYLSVMDLLCDSEVIPKHWRSVPPWGKFVLETIVAFLIGEFSMALVWLTMETLLLDLIKWTGFDYPSKMLVFHISTVGIGIISAVTVAAVTNRPAKMEKAGREIWSTAKHQWQTIFADKKQPVDYDVFIWQSISEYFRKAFLKDSVTI